MNGGKRGLRGGLWDWSEDSPETFRRERVLLENVARVVWEEL
jgi:hypothetical protein